MGRFLQVDPDPGKISMPVSVINKYAYVNNTPTSLTDPSGKFFQFFVFALVTASVATFYQTITGQVKGNDNIFKAFVNNFVTAVAFAAFAEYVAGTKYISTLAGQSYANAVGFGINAGAATAVQSTAISVLHNSTGAPFREMAIIFGYMYWSDMTADEKKYLFGPPEKNFLDVR